MDAVLTWLFDPLTPWRVAVIAPAVFFLAIAVFVKLVEITTPAIYFYPPHRDPLEQSIVSSSLDVKN